MSIPPVTHFDSFRWTRELQVRHSDNTVSKVTLAISNIEIDKIQETPGETLLAEAVVLENLEWFKTLDKLFSDRIKERERDIFACAAHFGRLDIFAYMRKYRDNPVLQTGWGLYRENFVSAVRENQLHIVAYIAKYVWCSIGEQNFSMVYSGLLCAIESDQIDVMKHLVDKYVKGIDWSCSDKVIKTALGEALCRAATLGRLEIVKYFIEELNCNPFYNDKSGNSVVEYAIENDRLNVFRYLVENRGIHAAGRTFLMHAVEHEAWNIVRYLVEECNEDLMEVDAAGNNVLTYARNLPVMMSYLLERQALNSLEVDMAVEDVNADQLDGQLVANV